MNDNSRMIGLGLLALAGYLTYTAPAPSPTNPNAPGPAPNVAPSPAPCPTPAPGPAPRKPWGCNEVPVGIYGQQVYGQTKTAVADGEAYQEALRRALDRERERAARRKAALDERCSRCTECVSGCRCGACEGNCRCGQGHPCRAGGCICLVGDEEPAVDLLAMPTDRRKKNIAAKGLGCCVFRSLDYASSWQNLPVLRDMPEWMVHSGIEGGGYPSKVDKLIPRIAADRKMPEPRYVQYEGKDPAVLELALRTGRVPCITWGGNHMLNCVYLDKDRGAILDNNSPDRVQWFSRQRFLGGWTSGCAGWAVVLLTPGPPPLPRNSGPLVRRLAQIGVEARATERENMEPSAGNPPAGVTWIPADNPVSHWSICGVTCTEGEGKAALEDDSARPHLTVIGSEQDRQRVLSDLASAPQLAGAAGRFRVQSYPPEAWEVSSGFVRQGMYIQDPTGKVLWRAESYTGPAQLVSALRRADPNYQPANDPGVSPLPGLSGLDLSAIVSRVPVLAWVAGGLGLLLLFRNPKGNQQ